MSLLTDSDIKNILSIDASEVENNQLLICPYVESSLTPVGYDLRVGSSYASSIDAAVYPLKTGERFNVRPRDTVLITTLEYVSMPQDRSISALITSKVSKVSLGLSHISTNVDADWRGKLLIAIYNNSRKDIILAQGEALCTMVFIKNNSPSTKVGGVEKESGRTDIIMKQFVNNSKIEQRYINRLKFFSYFLKISAISVFGGAGYYFFGPTAGFGAMAAIGIGIAGNINIRQM